MPDSTTKRERDRAYYALNRETIRAKKKLAYKANPAPAKERSSAYYKANPGKISEYRAENRDRRIEQRREWGKAHADRIKEYSASRDRDVVREYSKKYYAANVEGERQKSQAWRKANPELLREQQRRYRIENASKIYSKNAKRRAKLKAVKVEDVDRLAIYQRDKGLCGICNKPVAVESMTLDHVIPLARGGCHVSSNLQTAHRSCNSRKGAKLLPDIKLNS